MFSRITRHHGKVQSIIGTNHKAAVSKLSNKRRVFMADMILALTDWSAANCQWCQPQVTVIRLAVRVTDREQEEK